MKINTCLQRRGRSDGSRGRTVEAKTSGKKVSDEEQRGLDLKGKRLPRTYQE